MVVQLKKIKFTDLYKTNKNFKKKILENINSIITKSEFINGSYVKKFEKKFAKFNKVKFCQSCANGTDAIYAALKSLNVKSEDEVILSSHDWISSSEAVHACGAKPIFVDTKKDSFLIDIDKIENAISKNTKAIILVHIYGEVADLDKVIKITKKYNLKLIEDCAQAHLAKFKNRFVGTLGDIGCFSFFPTKNLGAFGDAGAIITNSPRIYKKLKMICNHGGLKKNQHVIKGMNSRLDNIQASILLEKIRFLEKENTIRKRKAKIYHALLEGIKGVKVPRVKNKFHDHVYHLYVLVVKKRNKLIKYLDKFGIETLIHYPNPAPFTKVNRFLKCQSKNFKNVLFLKNRIISIPFHPNITIPEMKRVKEIIQKFYRKN
jgi:dTDP-4-amino-4,6-dideoxygalactose transaminase